MKKLYIEPATEVAEVELEGFCAISQVKLQVEVDEYVNKGINDEHIEF